MMSNIYNPENTGSAEMLPLNDLKRRVGEIVFCMPISEWAKVMPYGLLFFGVTDPSRWEDIESTYGEEWAAYGIADIVWEEPDFSEIRGYSYPWRNMDNKECNDEEDQDTVVFL